MPELPDVAHFKKYLDATSLHRTVRRVRVLDGEMLQGVSARRFRGELEGRRFEATARHGKFLLVELDSGKYLVLHFGMTGHLKSSKAGQDTPGHARVVFELSDGYHLAYVCQRKLGRVDLVDGPSELVEDLDLGPDALDDALDFEAFRERLAGRRAAVKSALMDQGLLAGVGNVYSDEILFQARVHPKTPVGELEASKLRAVYRQMRKVLTTAADREGRIERLPRSYLMPHREGDERCPRCGTGLESIQVSGRTTWICPECQG